MLHRSAPDGATAPGFQAPPGEPLMDRLRRETADAHEALHHATGLRPLQQAAPLDIARYRAILARFDAVFAAAEREVLEPMDDWFTAHGFHRRSRRPDLADDIAALDALAPDYGAAPAAEATPGPGGSVVMGLTAAPGSALGVLYVTEGARLGGRTLARHLARILPPEAAGAVRFLGSGDQEVGAHWRAVGVLVNTLGQDRTRAADAVSAAGTVFDVMANRFREAP